MFFFRKLKNINFFKDKIIKIEIFFLYIFIIIILILILI